jgi:riboflavin kinase/FMN adenylyltransferase
MTAVILHDVSEYASRIGKDSALCIGNFDGVHPGHARLIGRAVETAAKEHLTSVVLTFEPHTLDVITKNPVAARLTSLDTRIGLLKETGVDAIVVQPFTPEFASIGPEEFMSGIVAGKLRARAIIVGPDVRFGRGGGGDRRMLEAFGRERGIRIIGVEKFVKNGKPISSSRIRDLLRDEGNVSEVLDILGRPYRIEGRVIRGSGRGRTLGFPTANLSDIDVLVPKHGIYAGAGVADGRIYPAALHIGERKTFDEPFSIEIYFIGRGTDAPLYDERVRAYLFRRLRDVVRFKDSQELRSRIKEDIDDAVEIYREMVDEIGPSNLEV